MVLLIEAERYPIIHLLRTFVEKSWSHVMDGRQGFCHQIAIEARFRGSSSSYFIQDSQKHAGVARRSSGDTLLHGYLVLGYIMNSYAHLLRL